MLNPELPLQREVLTMALVKPVLSREKVCLGTRLDSSSSDDKGKKSGDEEN